MNTFPATIELACPFPPDRGLRGACTTIADLSRQRGLLYPSKWLAIHTIIRANMERFEAAGKGQKSAHRLRRLRCAMAYEGVPQWEPSPEDINRMAAIDEEKHSEGHVPRHPFRPNPHD